MIPAAVRCVRHSSRLYGRVHPRLRLELFVATDAEHKPFSCSCGEACRAHVLLLPLPAVWSPTQLQDFYRVSVFVCFKNHLGQNEHGTQAQRDQKSGSHRRFNITRKCTEVIFAWLWRVCEWYHNIALAWPQKSNTTADVLKTVFSSLT